MRPLNNLALHSILATALVAFAASGAAAAGYLKLGDIKGDTAARSGQGGQIDVESWSWGETGSRGAGDRWFVADSFGFGVEREMKESGEKGGTEDINIGVGELQEATISKSMDASAKPATPERPMTWDNVKNAPASGARDGAKGGNVEFEWKVEEGESAPPRPGGVRVAAGDVDGDGRADRAASHDVKSPRDASSGLPTGKRQHKPLMLKAPLERGSLSVKVPAGMCRAGARHPTAEFGSGKRVYRLSGVVVTACTARSGDGIPMETLSLNYEKIVWK